MHNKPSIKGGSKHNLRSTAIKYIIFGVLLLIQAMLCTSCWSSALDWIDIDTKFITIQNLGTKIGKSLSTPFRIIGIVLLVIGVILFIYAVLQYQSQYKEDTKLLNTIENSKVITNDGVFQIKKKSTGVSASTVQNLNYLDVESKGDLHESENK